MAAHHYDIPSTSSGRPGPASRSRTPDADSTASGGCIPGIGAYGCHTRTRSVSRSRVVSIRPACHQHPTPEPSPHDSTRPHSGIRDDFSADAAEKSSMIRWDARVLVWSVGAHVYRKPAPVVVGAAPVRDGCDWYGPWGLRDNADDLGGSQTGHGEALIPAQRPRAEGLGERPVLSASTTRRLRRGARYRPSESRASARASGRCAGEVPPRGREAHAGVRGVAPRDNTAPRASTDYRRLVLWPREEPRPRFSRNRIDTFSGLPSKPNSSRSFRSTNRR